MEILTRLSHEEEIYTRQLAALHFPGSLESSGAHNSAFLLQQTREVYSTKSLEEAYPPKEGDQFEYGDPCGDYVTFDSLDALIEHHLKLENLETEFVSLKDALEGRGPSAGQYIAFPNMSRISVSTRTTSLSNVRTKVGNRYLSISAEKKLHECRHPWILTLFIR